MSVTPTISPRVASGSFASPIKRSKSSTNIKSKINQLASKSGVTNTSSLSNTTPAPSSGLGISPVVLASPNSKHVFGEHSSPTSKVHTNKFKFLDQEYLNELTLIIEKNFEAFEEKIFDVLNEFQQENAKNHTVSSADKDSDIISADETEEKLYEIKSILLEIVDRSKGNNSSLVSLNENLIKFNENISKDDSLSTLSENLQEVLRSLSDSESKIESSSKDTLKDYKALVDNRFDSLGKLILTDTRLKEIFDSSSEKTTALYKDTLEEKLDTVCKKLINDLSSQNNDTPSISKEQLTEILDERLSSFTEQLRSTMDTKDIKSHIEKFTPLDESQLSELFDRKIASISNDTSSQTDYSEITSQIKQLNSVNEAGFKKILEEKLGSLLQDLKASAGNEDLKSHIENASEKQMTSVNNHLKTLSTDLQNFISEGNKLAKLAVEDIDEILHKNLSTLKSETSAANIEKIIKTNFEELAEKIETNFSSKEEPLNKEILETSFTRLIEPHFQAIKETSSQDTMIHKLEGTRDILLKQINEILEKVSRSDDQSMRLNEVNDSVHAKLDALLSRLDAIGNNHNNDTTTSDSIKLETFKLQELIANGNEEASFLAKSNLEKLSEIKEVIETKDKDTLTEIKSTIAANSSKQSIDEIKDKLSDLVDQNHKLLSESNTDTRFSELTTLLQDSHRDIKEHSDSHNSNMRNAVDSISEQVNKEISAPLMKEVVETRTLIQSIGNDKDKEIALLKSIIESKDKKIEEYERRQEITKSIESLKEKESELKSSIDVLTQDKTQLLLTLNTIANKFGNMKNEIEGLSAQKQELIKSIESIEMLSAGVAEKSTEHKAALGTIILNHSKQRPIKDITNENSTIQSNKENKKLGKKRNFTTGVY